MKVLSANLFSDGLDNLVEVKMYRVKLISNEQAISTSAIKAVEKEVNEFLEEADRHGWKVVDIKLSTGPTNPPRILFSATAMVIYSTA